jgi:spore maturation protein CgeB
MRTFEVPGSHGLLISQYTDEQNSFFEQDKEAFYFETIDEAVLKMKFIINNKSLAKKVRLQGYRRAIKSNYAYEYRAKSMFDIIKKNN